MKVAPRSSPARRFAELWWVVLPPLILATLIAVAVAFMALADNPQGEFRNNDTGQIEANLWALVLIYWTTVFCALCAPLTALWLWFSVGPNGQADTTPEAKDVLVSARSPRRRTLLYSTLAMFGWGALWVLIWALALPDTAHDSGGHFQYGGAFTILFMTAPAGFLIAVCATSILRRPSAR